MENFVPTVSCPYWMFCVICRHPKPYTHSILVKVFGSPFLDTLTTRCSHIQHKDHIKDFKSYQSGTSIFIEILKTKSILRNSWQELTWQYVLHWYSKQRSTRNRRHTPEHGMNSSPRQLRESPNPKIQTLQTVCRDQRRETQLGWKPSQLSLASVRPIRQLITFQTGYQLASDNWPALKGSPTLGSITCFTASVLSTDAAIVAF